MFFIINRTRSQKSKPLSLVWKGKYFPTVKDLGDFVQSGDVVEMVGIETKVKNYHGVPYQVQEPYTYGSERVNDEGTGYISPAIKARQWIEEQVNHSGIILPHPCCGGKMCEKKGKRLDHQDIKSVADAGLCWSCRTPRRDVVFPRPNKK